MSQAGTIPSAPVLSNRPLVFKSAPAAGGSIRWTIWLVVAGMILMFIGGTWDFAWHMSIGRDTMWIAPHITVQLGGLLIGIGGVGAILVATFAGRSPDRDASVRILGLRGPAGAFIAVWGSLAIFISEPFDNWWHNAYGLDVQMITPPHSLLFLGSFVAKVGALAWLASMMSRSNHLLRSRLTWLFLLVGSLGVRQLSIVIAGPTSAVNMHTAECYIAVAMTVPLILVASGWGAIHRWGCTIAAAIDTAFGLGSEWILPLFPAQPRLGPVYHNVTHLIPMDFPLLIVVPAFVVDLLLQRLESKSLWTKAICIGPAFLIGFLVVQWPFADFLMSPASRNWVFGTAYFAYSDTAGFLRDPYRFNVVEKSAGVLFLRMTVALLASIVTTGLGLAWGGWMRRVRR